MLVYEKHPLAARRGRGTPKPATSKSTEKSKEASLIQQDYKPDSANPYTLRLAKNRYGTTPTSQFYFDKKTLTIIPALPDANQAAPSENL